jgi:glycosyltransferase involved in cell wall biosynthesis
MNNIPKVSVCIVTYNHEKYIRECLESIVTQKCNFDFEVIVGEDCSTDNTRIIVQEYVDKYPDIVKSLFQEKNVGGNANYFSIHNLAQGEYICHVDGDDYALPGKLQAQADFMDKTPDCNICFHRVKGLLSDNTIKNDLVEYKKIKHGFKRKDLLLYMAIATNSSKMYRKELKSFYIPDFEILDFFVNIEQIKDKKAYIINNQIYGVYRMGIGVSTNHKEKIKDTIYLSLLFFSKKYKSEKKYINAMFLVLFLADLKNNRNFILYLKGFLKTFHHNSILITLKTWKIRKMFGVYKVSPNRWTENR